MIDETVIYAVLAGIGIALMAGPLGCFIVWRRMSYFGDTIAHSALLGVSFALLLDINFILGVFVVASAIAMFLIVIQKQSALSSDAVLGILSHSSLALGLVCISLVTKGQAQLMGYLFGEILAVTLNDTYLIYSSSVVCVISLSFIWRPLLADTTSPELAQAEGMQPERARIIFMLMIACLIAITMKIVGILLITAMLIIPAATARRFSTSPEQMAVIAVLLGILSVITGLFFSVYMDSPPSPSIVIMALILFLISLIPKPLKN